MTNLKSILNLMGDETLLCETQKLVQNERELLSQILHHLREIDRRRLFSKLKLGSLYEYATKELGYSEDQAYRRIQAMRLLKELPEIEEKINDGSLSLSHLGAAQSLFKRVEKSGEKVYSKEEKLEVLEKLENTSKREAEKITLSLSTTPVAPMEKVRFISNKDIEIRFTAKEVLLGKIEKLKAMLANKNPDIQLSDLIDKLCDLGIEKWDKSVAPARKIKSKQSEQQRQNDNLNQNLTETQPQSQAQIRREVWIRDKGHCQICSTEYALEIDHIFPKALGGEDTPENLRLLCRSCNQRQAINDFGLNKMEKYWDA